MAVTQALTSANQYNKKPLKYAVDIMTLAKKAGYETYWISTQEQSSVSDAGITVIARQSDHQIWIKVRMRTFSNPLPRFLQKRRISSSCI